MSALTRSLFVLAVVALLYSACADSVADSQQKQDDQCTTVTKGREQGVKKAFDTIYIPAGQRTKTVDLERVCIDNINLYEVVTVCDDVAPTVHLRNWPDDRHWPLNTSVDVVRHGDYEDNVATIDVAFWCPH